MQPTLFWSEKKTTLISNIYNIYKNCIKLSFRYVIVTLSLRNMTKLIKSTQVNYNVFLLEFDTCEDNDFQLLALKI